MYRYVKNFTKLPHWKQRWRPFRIFSKWRHLPGSASSDLLREQVTWGNYPGKPQQWRQTYSNALEWVDPGKLLECTQYSSSHTTVHTRKPHLSDTCWSSYYNLILFCLKQFYPCKFSFVLFWINKINNNKYTRLIRRTQTYWSDVSRRTTHITPTLKSLHWLPIIDRIAFNILLLVFQSLHGTSPIYMTDIISRYHQARSLRSTKSLRLSVPRTHHSWGDRSFSHAAPELWNNLPLQLRQQDSLSTFKSSLKTHLFRNRFSV